MPQQARPLVTLNNCRGRLRATALVTLVVLVTACSASEPSISDTPTPTTETREAPSLTSAIVVGVTDGVTIDVQVDERVLQVRYLGVEVPEADPFPGDAPTLHERALQFNRFLVEGRTVDLEKGNVESDASGRLLRYVYVDGEMVNMALLTNGYATVASFPPDFKHSTSFAVAEEGARREGRGYWSPPEDGNGRDPATAEPFSGGTLPAPPSADTICEYSGTSVPVIKGNVESQTGDRLFYVPGDLLYSTTVVSEADGDTWFCTEEQAAAAGWTKSKH